MIQAPYAYHLCVGLLSIGWLAPAQAQWTQLGSDIIGQLQNEQAGFATDLNAAGDRLAIGAPRDNTNGISSGKVRVFQWDGADWTPLGTALLGDDSEDEFGTAVKLSADGSTLAIGAPVTWSGAGTSPGFVRVFDWSGTDWVQRGADLTAGMNADGFGAAIDLSASGDIVAIGAPYEATLASWAGRASVYQWNGMAWMPMGGTFAGMVMFSGTGGSVQLDHAGTVLAVGQEGQARVLVSNWNGSEWIPRDTLWGVQNFGNSISMDASGNTLAVGGEGLSPVTIGRVKVFQFNGTQYQQKGGPIDGQVDDLFLGWEQYALALREDGNALVAGSLGTLPGLVRAFQFDGQDWIPNGVITGSGIAEQIGRSVCMSADGSILAIGTPYSNGSSVQDAGIVQVYTSSTSTASADIQRTDVGLVVFPNPARDQVRIRSSSGIVAYELRSPIGQIITQRTVSSERETFLNLVSVSAGTYFLKVTTTAGSATIKLIRE